MPVRADGVIVQTLIALAMIGALGLVLRWTFGRSSSSTGTAGPTASGAAAPYGAAEPVDPRPAKGPVPPPAERRPAVDGSTPDGPTVDGPTEPLPVDAPVKPSSTDGLGATTAEAAVAEDFGLLTPVVTVETAASADRVRSRLRAAGIRATISQGRDGRYRVLVFSSDLHRARRVAGSSG